MAAREYTSSRDLLRGLDISLEQAGYCHFRDGLDAGRLVPLDLVDPDIVLAVTSGCKSSHCVVV